jgi:CRP-like cAMP-binding protein
VNAPQAARVPGERVANGRLLRLVKSGPERRALDSGQVDAILDAKTGTAFLLPQALPGGAIANSLLATLSREDYRSLLDALEPVMLTVGQVLYEPGDRIRHVYFPSDAHVSLRVVMLDRKALEVGLVGQEGVVGIALVLGAETSSVRVLVQGAGGALRMKAADFRAALDRCLPLQRELYRYAYAKLTQARQTAACNRFHEVQARLAGWLLLTRDRVREDQFHVTHELLGETLGVRRSGVSNAAAALQRRKLISYRRGDIRILDRKGLQAASCGCYEIVRSLAS